MKSKHGHSGYNNFSELLVGPDGISRDFAGITPVEFSYVEHITPIVITATSAGTSDIIVTSDTIMLDGKTKVLLEAYFPYIQFNGTLSLIFHDNAANTQAFQFALGSNGSNEINSGLISRRLTPSKGNHVFDVRGYHNVGGTASIYSTSASYLPGFLRVSRI